TVGQATGAATPAPQVGSPVPPASACSQAARPTGLAASRRRQRADAKATATAGPEKSASSDGYSDCLRLWDSGTHMSKRAWSRTCRRIENRLQNLQVENLDVDSMGAKARKKRKSPDAG